MYLSSATRFSIRSMMRSVVSTPTSEVISTSSRLSSTSSSTFDLPATARASFEKTPSLVFSRPLFKSSLFSFLEKKLKIPISRVALFTRFSGSVAGAFRLYGAATSDCAWQAVVRRARRFRHPLSWLGTVFCLGAWSSRSSALSRTLHLPELARLGAAYLLSLYEASFRSGDTAPSKIQKAS